MDRHEPTFPDLPTAPYWQAITPEELGSMAGGTPTAEDVAMAAGWQLAIFSVAHPGRRRSVWGWVRGAWAVNDFDPDEADQLILGTLTHLPTGLKLGDYVSSEEAAFAAALIDPVADWPAVTETDAPALKASVRATLIDGGFRIVDLRLATSTTRIFARECRRVH